MSDYVKDSNIDLNDRLILMCKPEQSGKTFIMIKMINNDINDESSQKTIINWIFCDNNLLLTKQTSARIKTDVKEHPDVKELPGIYEKYVEFSSRNDGTSQRTANDVYGKIMDGINNIICCTNSKRVSDVSSLITRIDNSKLAHLTGGFIHKIWLDEADKFNNYIKNDIIPLISENENVYCYCITATPERLFNKYPLYVLPIEKTTRHDYHGWNDSIIKILGNEEGSTVGFVNQTINKFKKENNNIIPLGTKWYIPADFKKDTHEMMSALLNKKGFAVFVVNGDGLQLSFPDFIQDILVEKTKELHILIREMWRDNNLDRFPVAITGHLCIGRAISFQQEATEELDEFIFDFGILSNCTNKSEVSQNAGRLKGNVKDWPGYKPPTIYTTARYNKIAIECEERSRELGRLAYSRDADEPSMVTKGEYKELSGESSNWTLITDEFNNLEDANNYLKQYKCRRKNTFKRDENNFILSSTTKKLRKLLYSDVKKEMQGWSALSLFDITKSSKEVYGRIIVCYKDLLDITSDIYIVRIIQKNK